MKNLFMGLCAFRRKLLSKEIIPPSELPNMDAPLVVRFEGKELPIEYIEETGEVRIVDQGVKPEGEE